MAATKKTRKAVPPPARKPAPRKAAPKPAAPKHEPTEAEKIGDGTRWWVK